MTTRADIDAFRYDVWYYYYTIMDSNVFRYGLQRFPSLKRITITPAAHGWLYTPLYQTPMIRAFPRFTMPTKFLTDPLITVQLHY